MADREDSGHLLRLLSRGRKARPEGVRRGALEGAASAAPTPIDPDSVVARVEAAMKKMPREEIADYGEFKRALSVLYGEVDRTLKEHNEAPGAPLTRRGRAALEAVIVADGTRPSMLLRNGLPPENHPLALEWADEFSGRRATIAQISQAVGRVEPEHGGARDYFGTCWIVDADNFLALTNLHVVLQFLGRGTTIAEPKDGRYRVHRGVFVDFIAETQSTERSRYKVVEAIPAAPDDADFLRLDIALLKLEPVAGESKPISSAIKVVADMDGPAGATGSMCIVGFPGEPQQTSGVFEGVDWGWVNQTLFGGRYGVKRIAPGNVHRRLGFHPEDSKEWIFGHDATTLGGNSGSGVFAWGEGANAYGIHFAGTNSDTNYAHAFAKCAASIEALGVAVVRP